MSIKGMPALLLHFIKENNIDIYEILGSLITKQYLEHLDLMKEAGFRNHFKIFINLENTK